ncbi:Cna B-type domain-containing protein, partial [Winkia sp. UMB6473-AN360BR]|uniref:Cna B-type domain-containing protein n=1 Tax=Winkia sp. UMB6473-AN360BR TaxID=3050611 RepID=UPI002554B856
MRLPKSVLGVLAAGALLLGGAVPAVAEDAVPGDGPTTSVSAPADEAGGAESGAVGADRSGSGEGGEAASTDSAASDTAQAPALRRAARAASLDGDYKFGARWANPVNASTTGYSYEDEAHTILSFDKMFNKLHTAMVDVDFNLTDTGNIKSLPVGAVKVTLPSALFKTWAGDASTHWAGPDTNFVEQDQMVTQVPKAPNTADSTSFNWSGDTKDVNGKVTVTNAKPINGSKSNSMGFSYSFIPTLLGVDGQGNYAKTFNITMEVDSNGDGVADFSKTQNLTVKAHTSTKASTVVMNKLGGENKPEKGLYFSWQDAWGAKPADANEYFYVIYVSEITRFGTRSESSTMPFTYTFEDTGSRLEEKGELIGAWEDRGRTRDKKPFTAQQRGYFRSPYTGFTKDGWENVFWSDGADKTTLRTWQGIDENFADGLEEVYLDFGGHYRNQISDRDTTGMKRNYMLMRYPVSLIDEAKARGVDMSNEGITVHNSVRLVQTPWNKNEAERYVVDVEAAANIVTTEAGKYDYDKDYRADHWERKPDRGGNAYGAQTAILAGKEAPMQSGGNSWGWEGSPSFDHWATSRASNPVWNKETGTYSAGIRTMIIDEDGAYLSTPNGVNNIPDAVPSSKDVLNNPLKLSVDDVHIPRISVAIEEYDATYSSAGVWEKNGSYSQDFERYKPVHIYAKMKGEPGYKLILSATRVRSNVYRYEYADGTQVTKDANLTSKVDLPEGIESLRYTHESDFFASSIRIQPQEILQPTDAVKAYVQKNVDDKQKTLYSHPATYYLQPEGGTKIDVTRDRISADPKDGTSEKAMSFVTQSLSQINRVSGAEVWTSKATDDPVNTEQKATITLMAVNRVGAVGDGMDLHAKYASDPDIMGKYAFQSGEFYTLIPAGVKVDLDSLHAGRLYFSSSKESNMSPGAGLRSRYQAIDKKFYDVETTPNYEGSGMTLLKISIKGLPEEDQPYPNKAYGAYDRPMYRLYAQFDVINSYGNIRDRGAELVQTAAFVDTDADSEWNPGTPNFDAANNPVAYQYYKPLADDLRDSSGETDHFGMAQRKLTFKSISIAEAGTEEQVRNVDSGEDWGASAEGLVNHLYTSTNYQYRLAYYQEKAAKGTGVVFYDVLDQAMKPDTSASEWQGTFQGVDLSAIAGRVSAGKTAAKDYANPVLYYATKAPTEFNVDDASVWTAYPEDDSTLDKSTIKAIAIDVRKTKGGDSFVVPEASSLVAYVNMKTPSDDTLDGKTATNEHLVKVVNFTGNAPQSDAMVSDLYAAAHIELHKVDVGLTKSSNPATGTKAAPKEVENAKDTPITYTLKVENKDDKLALTDLVLQDSIPAGLTIDTEKITVSSSLGEAAPVDGRVEFKAEGQKLSWSISELPVGEVLTFTIPTTLSQAFDKLQRFENTAYLKQVNGIGADIASETMYHQAQPLTEVSGTKTWDDNEDQDGKRPESITVTLLADGKVTGKTATVTAGAKGEWKYSFTDVKTYRNDGTKIVYSVSEKPVDGYTTTYNGMDVTNTHTPELINIPVTKVWVDDSDAAGKRPDSVTVRLLADGEVVDNQTLTLNA